MRSTPTGVWIIVLIEALLLVGAISMLSAPRPPHPIEVQSALDMYVFEKGWCPAYSSITLFEDGSWICEPN